MAAAADAGDGVALALTAALAAMPAGDALRTDLHLLAEQHAPVLFQRARLTALTSLRSLRVNAGSELLDATLTTLAPLSTRMSVQ